MTLAPLPEIRTVPIADHVEALRATIDLLIVTATEVERDAVLRRLAPLGKRKTVVQGVIGPSTFYVGALGPHGAALTMCRMGTVGSGASKDAVREACALWAPRAAVMVGIAFGKDEKKQGLGDVLVSSQVVSYEEQRVGDALVDRGPSAEASRTLVDRFRNVVGWGFPRADGTRCKSQIGPILSGEKLVANAAFKAELLKRFPQAIGGEMEGRGLYAAASEAKVDWILAKGICDWGDENKHDGAHALAAAAAVDLTWAALSNARALDGLEKAQATASAKQRASKRKQPQAAPAVVAKNASIGAGRDVRGNVIVTGTAGNVTVRGKR